MPLVTLKDVLKPANAPTNNRRYAVAGLVTLGWEDMRAFVAAAEAENQPIILQAGPSCREHTPLPILGKMLRHLAEGSSVPIVAHLDHGYTFDECQEALDAGFTSLMYDGSRKPFAQNVTETARIVELAHSANISCEGEIGFVGYAENAQSKGEASAGTDPDEAAEFARQTGVDALAVSVGNVHLQQDQSGGLDEARIAAIDAVTDLPLVIHGGSGVPAAQRRKLAQTTSIAKFNIGTELRMAFGSAMRAAVVSDPDRFDRVQILRETHDPVVEATRAVLRTMG